MVLSFAAVVEDVVAERDALRAEIARYRAAEAAVNAEPWVPSDADVRNARNSTITALHLGDVAMGIALVAGAGPEIKSLRLLVQRLRSELIAHPLPPKAPSKESR